MSGEFLHQIRFDNAAELHAAVQIVHDFPERILRAVIQNGQIVHLIFKIGVVCLVDI